MGPSSQFSATALLERPTRVEGATTSTEATSTSGNRGRGLPTFTTRTQASAECSFRAPGLITLASIAIFEGYERLGVIPTSHAGLSAVIIPALLLPVAGFVLTWRRRTLRWPSALVLFAGAAVFIAAVFLATVGGRFTSDVLGIAYLLLGIVMLSAIVDGLTSLGGRRPHLLLPSTSGNNWADGTP
jgi:hypothetical protein